MLVTDKPEDLKPENALADIPHELLGQAPATIRMSGKDLLVMEKPPEMGDFVKMEITMRCKDDGRTLLADGGIGHYRVMSFVAAKVTTEPYKPADDEAVTGDDDPALIDRDGNIPDDEGDPDQDETGGGLDEFDPAFSSGTSR